MYSTLVVIVIKSKFHCFASSSVRLCQAAYNSSQYWNMDWDFMTIWVLLETSVANLAAKNLKLTS